jgi:hypothetical protein
MTIFTARKKLISAGAVFSLLVGASGLRLAPVRASAAKTSTRNQAANEGKFYCNIKALNPAERAHQKQLTEKLIAARTDVVELPKGYEFQFDPSTVSLAEVVDWVVTDEKCCPFFNFHIDLEREGKLVCLGLGGEEGIKQFIRSEFKVPAK